MPELDTEVLVIGGGIVGNTLAGLLGSSGIACTIIEAAEETESDKHRQADPRALAMTVASRRILQSFNLWRQIPADRLGHFRQMHVWDEAGNGSIDFDSADICQSTIGYIIEQTILQAALDAVLRYMPSVTIHRGATVKALYWHDDAMTVELDGQTKLRARLVVAADGVHSPARALAGIEYKLHDYQQQAVACVVKTALPHAQIARQRFLMDGPLAFLPMAESHQCGVIWSTTPEYANKLLSMQPDDFNYVLQSAFEYSLGEVQASGPRTSFALKRAQAQRYCRDRFVLIGDAAHSIHPMAGQGANMGLLDAASLAQVLLEARLKNKDIGSMRVLRRYERWRKGENMAMMMVVEGLKHLFENQTGPLPLLRSAGMGFINSKSTLKHWIMRRAMGLTGDLPEIARP